MGCVACNYNPYHLLHTCERYKTVSETFRAGDIVTSGDWRFNDEAHEVIAVYDDLAWVVPVAKPRGACTFEAKLYKLTKYVPKWEKNARYETVNGNPFEVVHVFPSGDAGAVWDTAPDMIERLSRGTIKFYRKVS